jgi:hypothetical protein
MPVFVVAVVAILGLFVLMAVLAYKREQKRIATLLGLCRSKGWQFSKIDPFGLAQRWPGEPFESGYARTAENVITGEFQAHPIVAFDYSYKEDSTDSKGNRTTSTYHFAIVAMGMPCALPGLHVGPEGLLSRLGQALGMQDIELESEDFNRTFRVRCPDPKFATDILTPRNMEMLLASGKCEFRFVGSDILWIRGGVMDPVEVDRATHVMAALIGGVPSFVWRDYGLERPVTPSPGNLT